jgi:hypothetical protein
MKKNFLVFSIFFLSLTQAHGSPSKCFEVKMNPVVWSEGTRVPQGKTLELKFKANKVKVTFAESGENTRFVAHIVKKDEFDQGPEYMGSIDSEMYTLVIKESPPFYFEPIEKTGHIFATLYLHGSSGVDMFCDFIKEKHRFY